MITEKYISKKAAEHGFSAAYCCSPQEADGMPENVRSLVLLLRAYYPQNGLVDAFYQAKQASYTAAAQMCLEISKETGVQTYGLSNHKLKPIATQRIGLARGLNTLNYHPEFGSKFCMELIGFSDDIDHETMAGEKAALSCGSCERCMKACPGGAITKDGFVKEKCIRFYMMNGKPMPEHLRQYIGAKDGSYAIIGCDICQRVCPGNARREENRQEMDANAFTLEELLDCSAETRERFGNLYGHNYDIRNRIISQALLAAGNSGDEKYLPLIEPYLQSKSAAVQEHAAWAVEKIKNLQNNY